MSKFNLDILILYFGNYQRDSRSLNLFNTAKEENKLVKLITSEGTAKENIDIISLKNQRHYRRWAEFVKLTKIYLIQNNIKPRKIIAGDLYSLPIGTRIKRKLGSKLYYDSREIYSALGPLQNSPIKQYLITKIEKYHERFVDEFIVSGELDTEVLKKHFHHDKKYHVVMNLPPYKERISSNKIKDKFGFNDEKNVIIYQGELLNGRGIEKVIYSISLLPKNYVFVIIGVGPQEKSLKELVKKLQLENKVFFTDLINYSELHEWTCSADIGVALFEDITGSYRLALPNKIFEYFMAGLPVITTKLPAIEKVIEETNTGIALKENFTHYDICNCITSINSSAKRELFVTNALNAAKQYNYENQKNTVRKIIE